jgi:hypothetical protein
MGAKKDLRRALDLAHEDWQRILVENRRLREEIEARDAGREATLREALRDMAEHEFAIITRSGRVVAARAVDTRIESAPYSVGAEANGWAIQVPGPREYTANIVLSSINR